MSFRIMGISRNLENFEVVVRQGITFPGNYIDRVNNSYGSITSSVGLKEPTNVKLCYEYNAKEQIDGYNEVMIHPILEENSIAAIEEGILLMIEIRGLVISWEKNVKKLAGRYPDEGIFLLTEGDEIHLKGKNQVTFFVVRRDEKLYLVKAYEWFIQKEQRC